MLAVTGITGHTGQFFLENLVKHKYEGKVRCLIRNLEKKNTLNWGHLDVDFIEGSLEDSQTLYSLLDGVDTVVHIANIHFSNEIIRVGKECGIKRYVLVHTTGIFSQFKEASAAYIDIENQIVPQLEELNITIVRPTMIFGDMNDYNVSKFIRFIDRVAILPIIDKGCSLIQPVNARDLGRALYQILCSQNSVGKAYNLSGSRPISIKELYDLIGKALQKKRVILSFPLNLCVFCARAIRFSSMGKIDLVEKVQRMGENRSFTHSEATKDFGYYPEPFEVGLLREVEEYLSRK